MAQVEDSEDRSIHMPSSERVGVRSVTFSLRPRLAFEFRPRLNAIDRTGTWLVLPSPCHSTEPPGRGKEHSPSMLHRQHRKSDLPAVKGKGSIGRSTRARLDRDDQVGDRGVGVTVNVGVEFNNGKAGGLEQARLRWKRWKGRRGEEIPVEHGSGRMLEMVIVCERGIERGKAGEGKWGN